MKIKTFLLTALVLFVSAYGFSQKFTGTIIYSINFEELPAEAKEMAAFLPKEMSLTAKGELARIEMETGIMGKQITLIDNNNKTLTQLTDMMGQKMAVVNNFDSEDDNETPKPKIEKTDETKVIAGYTCKKVIMYDENTDANVVLYVTNEIPNLQKNQFKGVEGMPLEYTISVQGLKMTFSATKVEKKEVKDSIFEIPEGYTKMNADSMNGMFEVEEP
jgi:GLPGLI family protein